MPNLGSFTKCIEDNLKDKRFGHKRIQTIKTDFEARFNSYVASGKSQADAGALAMKDTFDNLAFVAQEKIKRTVKMLSVQAENTKRIRQAINADPSKTNGADLAQAAVSLLEHNSTYSGTNYATQYDVNRNLIYAGLSDVLSKFGKGAWGRQRGKAHMGNIIDEMFGQATGDESARIAAESLKKTFDMVPDMFNAAGGSMLKMKGYIPQPNTSVAKLVRNKEAWIKSRMDRWDWSKMRWPDGKPIDVADRADVAERIYQTLSTDGANKIDPSAFRGRGKAVGNALDNHRFVHYKDAASWKADHQEFGDGNVMDQFISHLDHMAHKITLVQQFGPNPEMTAANINSIVKAEAAKIGPRAVNQAEAAMKNKFDPIFDLVTRSNPSNPESILGSGTVATSNLLTSAQLGSASLLAIPGDFMQSIAVRAFNKMDLFGGIGTYFKTIATDRRFMEDIATQCGFVMDEVVKANYAATRFTGVATVGPAWSRNVSDAVMRASLMSGHTKAARWAAQSEFMGLLNRMSKTAYDDLPFVEVMKRYGITAADWDAFRNGVKAWSPRNDINFLRPIDILQTNIPEKEALFRKFQGMIFDEARTMVPESTMEGTVMLKDTSRPDTLRGAILHSFSMYKNFPVSFWMIYGRLGMTSKSVKGRLAFYAGLGAGMTMVGALGIQMREIAQGRDPMPMDSPQFLGKAFLSGGALSIWGDFLFSGVNRMNGGPTETVAGPLFGFLGDTTQLAFGDAFKFMEAMGSLDQGFDSTTKAKLVEYMKRYTPGSNLWWLRTALERNVWERLQELADPKAFAKRRRKEANQRKVYGNESYWPAGESLPTRFPQYQGSEQ